MTDTQEVTALTIVRRLGASPDRVFRAWTDPEALAKWFFPADGYRSTAEADARVGGRYRIRIASPEGKEYEVFGVYKEIVENARLVFTWSWKESPEAESVVTVELKDRGGATELTLTHDRLPDLDSRRQHEHGWTGCLGQLERYLA